jgi:large subunit ribosomal protein L6
MSRIGKKAVVVPAGVTAKLSGQAVSIKGPKGELSYVAPEEIEVTFEGGQFTFAPRADTQRARAMWGLTRTLVGNMVEGVTKGYEQVLELVGVGYRAQMKGATLGLQLGFSHEIEMPPPPGISFASAKPTEIRISGIDKQMVGEVAARIRKIRPPEPYKGKGVRYSGETVRRKEGKKK